VLTTYRHLIAPREPTADEVDKCQILGWCIEWLQAFFLVADDIMDGSLTRRGQPCWYKQDGVGTIAINDSFLIESAIYKLLKRHFKKESYYVDLIELLHETTYQTELGQLLDLITAPEDQMVLHRFTIEKHTNIVKYKTAFYSFYLPVAMAMLMAGVADEAAYNNAKDILIEMGVFFQVQDDYLDCYGDPKVIGKIGTDIQDNKCGWLVVQALKRVTPEQRKILEDNYARKDAECEARVKALYKELNLEQLYKDYEEQHYTKLMGMIEEKAGSLPREIFTDFAAKIYKRNK
jgi:farnesyl diphosphate synthase